MPARIIKGVLNYVSAQLNANVWEGEIPRYDTAGNPIEPLDVSPSPSVWPVIRATMTEEGFGRTWTTEDPYDDLGNITIQIWGITRDSVENQMDTIEALLAQASNWPNILTSQGPPANPYYVIQMLLIRWSCIQEEGVRLAESQLCYRGDLHYEVNIHGAISTA